MKTTRTIASLMAIAVITACGDENGGAEAAAAQTAQDGAHAGGAALVDPQAVNQEDLQRIVSSDRVRQFYEGRDWQPAWTAENAPELVQTLRAVGKHGLDPADYVAPVEDAGTPAEREAALTAVALDLGDALGDGKADPNELFSIYTIPRPELDLVGGLGRAVNEGNAGQWLESLAPSDAQYRALSEAYLRYAREAAEGAGNSIESGDLIHEGDSDPRVPQIAEVLRTNGYLQGDGRDEPNVYTPAISRAIERLQGDFGIAEDGVVGPNTLEILNTGAEERSRILAVNLERLRWLPRDRPATRIDVNVAAAQLDYYRDGDLRDQRVVVVGQPGWETPQLGSPFYRFVANPTWTVPRSIEEEEIANRGPGYLQRNNMVRRDGWIVQLPGPENALGLVKFDLQNDYAIYLHDTPAKSLFDRNQRHLSHGCIRVENAPQFARMLAEDMGILAEYRNARETGEETFVDLPQNIPVRLLYHTAFLSPSGDVRFRTDAYGWDERVAEALGYEPRRSPTLETHIQDLGP